LVLRWATGSGKVSWPEENSSSSSLKLYSYFTVFLHWRTYKRTTLSCTKNIRSAACYRDCRLTNVNILLFFDIQKNGAESLLESQMSIKYDF
jgi:hypothetical protein